jgi:hypothetical protein
MGTLEPATGKKSGTRWNRRASAVMPFAKYAFASVYFVARVDLVLAAPTPLG